MLFKVFFLLILALFLPISVSGQMMMVEVVPVTEERFHRDLSLGMKADADVAVLQEFLRVEGFYDGLVTGNYLSATAKAVSRLQGVYGLPMTGYFGPMTRLAINALLDARANYARLGSPVFTNEYLLHPNLSNIR